MTLIIGQKCVNGLVLASDRKILRDEEAEYADKIFELGGVVLAFEGLTGIRDDFLLLLRSEMDRARGFTSLYEVKLLVEDIVAGLSQRYADRLGEDALLGALLGGLSGISNGQAELYYVHPEGYGESVHYRCSGHGADYAHSLAKYVLESGLSIEESGYRAAFLISWVSDDIDSSVGGIPQVALIEDEIAGIRYLDDRTVQSAMRRATSLKQRLPRALGLTKRSPGS